MRVSKETMERHHRQILAIAAAKLRERGVQGVSVAELMQAAGLTHGGFYRHFPSKDALVAEATKTAFAEILARLENSATRIGAPAALETYVKKYLSPAHLGAPSQGCPIAAMGPEISRESAEARAAFDVGVAALIQWIGAGLACPEPERVGRATALLSLMVGAVVAARACGDPDLSAKILAEARQGAARLTKIFSGSGVGDIDGAGKAGDPSSPFADHH